MARLAGSKSCGKVGELIEIHLNFSLRQPNKEAYTRILPANRREEKITFSRTLDCFAFKWAGGVEGNEGWEIKIGMFQSQPALAG